MKQISVGIIGDSGHIDGSYNMSTKELCIRSGNNSGNLVFRYAVSHHIASPKHYFTWDTEPALVKELCDVVVFPAANQINSRYNWGKQADFIEKVDLPCVVVGLGAQASELDTNIELQKGTVKWVKAIASRSHCIGVRGEYTADVLAKLGVKNTVVIGCPSNFINPNPSLGRVIERKLRVEPRNLVINESAGRDRLKFVERKLVDWLCLYGGNYVCQSPENMIALARKRFDEVEQSYIEKLHQYLLPRLAYEEFLVFVKQYFQIFFSVNAWLEFLSSMDLSIGTRMHGNLLSIQSSTPGICIYHDSRTQELSRTTLIPRVSVKQFLSVQNIRELINETNFQGENYDINRIKLAIEYQKILTNSGIDTSDSLKKLTNSKTHQANYLKNFSIV
jgi:hypothetical protein